jgi:hypothetical protein
MGKVAWWGSVTARSWTFALVGSAGNGSLGGTDRQLCDESAVHTERRMNVEASKRRNWMLGPEERGGSDSDAMDALGAFQLQRCP